VFFSQLLLRRQADERVSGGRNREKSHCSAKAPLPTSSRKPSDDGRSSTGTLNDGLASPTDGPYALNAEVCGLTVAFSRE
jgi:hypothetical protein